VNNKQSNKNTTPADIHSSTQVIITSKPKTQLIADNKNENSKKLSKFFRQPKLEQVLISDLPFRPGVGMMIVDSKNRIFLGKRVDSKINGWQMPQGGIDIGETPSKAALREMEEEIGCNKGYIIAESKNWYSYRIPEFLIPKLWNGKYCGQRQKWFLIRFIGKDSDININTKHPEFDQWKWVNYKELLLNILPFKIKLYKQVIKEFSQILEQKIRNN
jgi:putative (di)nucleoside polyphosphate hydrolase